MRSWNTTGHPDWPYDDYEELDEYEDQEDPIRKVSDMTHELRLENPNRLYPINMQTFAAKLLKL